MESILVTYGIKDAIIHIDCPYTNNCRLIESGCTNLSIAGMQGKFDVETDHKHSHQFSMKYLYMRKIISLAIVRDFAD
jgi:hypothetical protein